MQTLIYNKINFQLPPHILLNSKSSKNHRDFLRIRPQNLHHALETQNSCSAAAPLSLNYGGWDDSQVVDDSVNSGESNQFLNLMRSIGIADKKYVFVYLFGFVCALAISRVRVSTIVVFPASAIVFALGFSVGLVKGGRTKELRLNDSRIKIIEGNVRSFIEKLRDNLKGYDAEVLNLKNSIRRSIESKHVTVSDLEGYIDVIESAEISQLYSVGSVESCAQNLFGGNKENVAVSNHDPGKVSKKFGVFGWKFGGPHTGKVETSSKTCVDESKNKELPNVLVASIEEGNLNCAPKEELENKSVNTARIRNGAESFVDWTGMEDKSSENYERNVAEINDTTEAVFDQTTYSYQDKKSRFANSDQVHFNDYPNEFQTKSFHNNSYNSVDVSISMNHVETTSSLGHKPKRGTMHRNHLRFVNTEDHQHEFHRNSYTKESISPEKRPSVLGDDLEFNRFLAEASNLLKEAKGYLTQQADDCRAEHALQKSAKLLSKAIDMRPMSLLAVGQLGNTYLLHGELKLRMSRELRSLLVRTDPLLEEEWGKVLKKFDDQFTDKDEITSALANICEECEELLINAGRKYKLALSIDGSDMRAMYNWGLALTFRAQLIADIGPSAARDADMIFLAAIDKFDAMMSKSNVFTPDALYRWGAALQHRSRLRPRHSREKVKLLQQARQLYEDALDMDSGNRPLRQALSSCVSELDSWYT